MEDLGIGRTGGSPSRVLRKELKEEREVDKGEAKGETERLHRSVLQDKSQCFGPAPRASTPDEDEVGPKVDVSAKSPGEADMTRGEAPPPTGQGTKREHEPGSSNLPPCAPIQTKPKVGPEQEMGHDPRQPQSPVVDSGQSTIDYRPQSHKGRQQHKEGGEDPHSTSSPQGEHVKMSNHQDEKTATIRALEEQMRDLVRERDRVRRDIRVRELCGCPMDKDFIEQQAHNHRILILNNGNIEGMDAALAVVLNSSPGYPNSPTGAMGSSWGSSMSSNSPAEGTSTNIFSRGRAN